MSKTIPTLNGGTTRQPVAANSPVFPYSEGGTDYPASVEHMRTEMISTLYAGTDSTRTYDPGATTVALDSCTITVPASSVARTFMVIGHWLGSTSFSTSHGVRSSILLDGSIVGVNAQGWAPAISGESVWCHVMEPVTIPGDSASHTISIGVADSGATGNLTFLNRWICAMRVA